jgi:hypothetical protein
MEKKRETESVKKRERALHLLAYINEKKLHNIPYAIFANNLH